MASTAEGGARKPVNMVRKKVDPRVRTLIENCVKQKFRSFFVIVGDRGRQQVVNLHYMLSKALIKARPSLLWCYKKDLGFTSHHKKRQREVKKKMQRGLYDPDRDDPFELFLSSTNIHYSYYADSHKILGNTFGMCVLQDFEALEPNLLARTIETVEGGGIVVLLLKTMKSLKQLYAMTMDVHARLRTETQHEVVGRFNERFLLSLASCSRCLVVDDELNILPISSHSRNITAIENISLSESALTPEEVDLRELKSSLKDTEFVGALVESAKTLDQAKTILTCIEAISEKNLRTTVAITAARGRGKSAAMGISVAAAVASGYSNVFVTSPSPENLKTLFEFVLKGFDTLGYQEHLDYDIIQSTNPEFNKAVIRINVYRTHRQTIQYIHPQDHAKLGQAELVVIDEAAAIPLPYVKQLLGPYLVFMSSTVNGYEGTGRSLSLKLIQQLREQSAATLAASNSGTTSSGRILRELEMKVPIRYAMSDPVEKWLNELLCLDATIVKKLPSGCPHPTVCNLYYVNRDTLFSYHKASETFLQRMMALYVSSHYKNSPNDLLLMSDAPAHHLFVLLGPVDETANTLPEILAVVQVALEGRLTRESVKISLSQGKRAHGDLIPWLISQQYQDDEFAGLSGARVVRIATHPDYTRMGYGSRALEQLISYYQGDMQSMEEEEEDEDSQMESEAIGEDEDKISLMTEEIKPRRNLPPLLSKLDERKPEALDWLGTSFGITQTLYNFWAKSSFLPTYIRLTSNELTGEHSCVMMRNLNKEGNWLSAFHTDFKRRFLSLLSFDFKDFSAGLALSVLNYKKTPVPSLPKGEQEDEEQDKNALLTSLKSELDTFFSRFDVRRLESYANNIVDFHIVLDLLPHLARLYFIEKFAVRFPGATASIPTTLAAGADSGASTAGIQLPYLEAAILLALGLQHKTIDNMVTELTLQPNQVLSLFNKAVKKFSKYLREMEEWAIDKDLPRSTKAEERLAALRPLDKNLDDELDESGRAAQAKMLDQMSKVLGPQYKIKGSEEDWSKQLAKGGAGAPGRPASVTIRRESDTQSTAANGNDDGTAGSEGHNKRGGKKGQGKGTPKKGGGGPGNKGKKRRRE
eukprot:TRINITY_DN3711_c0_g1_i1.p1 TRINITY_DN3711_c0_g1~~TRINITY_DN3711_c0_g1_i1.p1  ORF type:complete len:1097 (+),score=223.23 TRINITY_DN3711_c0_g1_i1:342-3632(+)